MYSDNELNMIIFRKIDNWIYLNINWNQIPLFYINNWNENEVVANKSYTAIMSYSDSDRFYRKCIIFHPTQIFISKIMLPEWVSLPMMLKESECIVKGLASKAFLCQLDYCGSFTREQGPRVCAFIHLAMVFFSSPSTTSPYIIFKQTRSV